MVILMLANDMVVQQQHVLSQIDTGLETPYTISSLEAVGYKQLHGRDANGYPLSLLPKSHFKYTAKRLFERYDMPFFKWQGRLPFEQFLPGHVVHNWS